MNDASSAFDFEFFRQHAESAVGGDEVDAVNVRLAFDGEQEMAQKNRAAGAGSRDRQILRRMVGQESSVLRGSALNEAWSIGIRSSVSQA